MNELDFERAAPEEVLQWVYGTHRRVALVASFQAESGVLIDMASRVVPSPEVVTIDTGRLPSETHEVIDQIRERYPIRLRVVTPDAPDVEQMTSAHGVNLFRRSVELRYECCKVRKVTPLDRTLRDYDAWITGLRRDQAPTRGTTPVVTQDARHGGIAKAAPLARWSREQVREYMAVHSVPSHPLYERGYTSIGCAPCTRATRPGEDERAGRWWWERGEPKECGLHAAMAEAAS